MKPPFRLHRVGAALAMAAGLAGLLGASPAKANLVTSTSGSFTINDLVLASTTGGPADLTATVTFSNYTFTFNAGTNTTTFTMNMDITNTTNPIFTSARLTAVGFNIDPNALTASDNTPIYDSFLNQTFPSFQTVDLCLSSGSNCAGGANGGLSPGGTTGTFTETLTFAGDISSVDLGASTLGAAENFDFKWQTGIGSFESQCTFGASCTTTVPEPATLAIFGTALAGLGLIGRRRRKNV